MGASSLGRARGGAVPSGHPALPLASSLSCARLPPRKPPTTPLGEGRCSHRSSASAVAVGNVSPWSQPFDAVGGIGGPGSASLVLLISKSRQRATTKDSSSSVRSRSTKRRPSHSEFPIASLVTLVVGGCHLDAHSDASAANDTRHVPDDDIDNPIRRLQLRGPHHPHVVSVRTAVPQSSHEIIVVSLDGVPSS